jgi:amidohydrolase
MPSLEQLKELAIQKVDDIADELKSLSIRIHQNPEIAFKEEKASTWLTEFLGKYGFQTKKGIAGLPTAFQGIAQGKSEKPSVGLLAEYDALPGLGHACGHNIMATAGPGAAVAVKLAIPDLPGPVKVFGTPAEENGGGKYFMVKSGAFEGLDAALLVHPFSNYEVNYQSIASQIFRVEFFGKPAHASSSAHQGHNALEAMINSFTMINSLRQHLKPDVRIHGVIINGGEAYNIVPKYTSGEFAIRTIDDQYMDELIEKVKNIFMSAAQATGCTVKFEFNEARYSTMKSNRTLASAYAENLRKLGLPVQERDPKRGLDSSDIGNVSQVVPTIQPYVKIADPGTSLHTIEFREAAVSESGHKGLLDTAKALAITTIDVLYNEELRKQIHHEFQKNKIG